jgi:hypothetical protein
MPSVFGEFGLVFTGGEVGCSTTGVKACMVNGPQIWPPVQKPLHGSEMDELLPTIEVETADKPGCAVIWRHGLGADGSDFAPIVPEFGLDGYPGIRFIFPHAPHLPVTCNGD